MPLFRAIRLLAISLVILFSSMLTSCASLLVPEAYEIEAHDIQSKVAKQFPFKRDFLNQRASLVLNNPVLELIPQQDKLAVQLRYRANLLGQAPVEGTVRIRSGLQYESSDQSLRLRNVSLDSFSSSLNMPNWIQNGIQLAAEQVLKTNLENYLVYQLKPSQKEDLQRLGLRIGQPKIEASRIRIPLLKN